MVLLSASVALAQQYNQQPQQQLEEQYGPAQYNFDWSVKDQPSGNDFGQHEERDGEKTSGSYFVALPDGRIQKVTYSVDGESGYKAEVTYEGEAQFPGQQQQAYPSAPAPAPAAAPAPGATQGGRYSSNN